MMKNPLDQDQEKMESFAPKLTYRPCYEPSLKDWFPQEHAIFRVYVNWGHGNGNIVL